MPYIRQEARNSLEPEFTAFIEKFGRMLDIEDHPNALYNYTVFRFLRLTEEKYISYPRMSGAMAGVNDSVEEFRRRFVNTLEDEIRKSRGDVP